MSKKSVQTKPEKPIAKPRTKSSRASKSTSTQFKTSTPAPARSMSKSDQLLALLRRSDGATLEDLMKASHWQPHSVREDPCQEQCASAWA